MRVNTLTLATAALTIGLASPALASPTLGDHQGTRTQALLQRGGDDCGGGGGCADSFTSRRHCGSAGSCGRLFGGPFGFGGAGFGGGGFGGGGFGGGGGGGDRAEYGESGGYCCAQHARAHARVAVPHRRMLARPGRVIVHRRQVVRVPRRAVPTGFGGSQGMNLPLGLAGMSLILGGAGLLPLTRRRIRTSERS